MTYARIGKYSATAPTLSDGETTFLRTNANGDLVAVLSGSSVAIPVDVQYHDLDSDPLPILGTGSKTIDIVFHNAAVVAADGTQFSVGGYKTLTVEILSTATSFTCSFKAEGPSGADIALMGVNLTTLATGINTSTSGQLWQFDITGLTKVFMDITAMVAGAGSVTIKGTAVA